MRLLVRGKGIDHAVDGRRCAVGVQSRHHQNAHLGRRDRRAHGLQVAQLAHQDDVRVLTQGRQQGGGKGWCVCADLALADQAVVARMHELNGILDRDDMSLDALVDVIDHGRQRRGLARTGLAGDQDQAIGGAAQLVHGRRHLQRLQRQGAGRDRAEYGPHAGELAQHVDAKAPVTRQRIGEIRTVVGLEALDGFARHDLVQGLLDEIGRQRFRTERGQVAVTADARRIPGDQVQVGPLAFEDLFQHCVDLCHGQKFRRRRQPAAADRAWAAWRCP